MKIAIVTDSNSGITQAQAGELGIFVLPMPFMINGETFEEDINLTQEEFYKRQAEDAGYQHLPAVSAGCNRSLGQTACGRLRSDRAYPDVQRLKRLLSDGPHAGR